MNWYYAERGQQSGPVTEEQLSELLRAGTITLETLVWRDGLPGWAPYREVLGTPAAPAPTGPIDPPSGPEAVCSQCGKMFPLNDTIRYGDARVCASCKPVFLQKLREGAAVNSHEASFAPILTRFAAVFLDGLILAAINMLLGFLVGMVSATIVRNNPGAILVMQGVLLAIELTIGMTYEGVMVAKYGATLGKMACKIKVVTADGGPISYGRAFGRYWAKQLSGLTCLIGYIIAIFDNPQKRALHDHLCNTRVVLK